jgi:hypothetical protein
MSDDLQFETAEYASGVAQCSHCDQDRGTGYFHLGQGTFCAPCKALIGQYYDRPISPAGYARALGAGVGVAVGGAIVWALVIEFTGMELGILGIAVGWGVAAVMRWGAGRGARSLQVASLVLTYLAIVESSVPTLARAMDPDLGALAIALSMVMALGLPFFVVQSGASSILWFVIVGFSMHAAWRRLAHPPLAWTGPLG